MENNKWYDNLKKGDKIIYVITNSMSSTDITSTYVLQKGEQ